MIETNDPKFKEIIDEIEETIYIVNLDKLPPGESIACKDDKDMTITKQEDGTCVLSKKAFSSKCFS